MLVRVDLELPEWFHFLELVDSLRIGSHKVVKGWIDVTEPLVLGLHGLWF
jgi:hypothetical protein